MFTGLVEDVGVVDRLSSGMMTDIWVRPKAIPLSELRLGESVACSGACLTVVEVTDRAFRVQASPETLRCTTLDGWRVGTEVNLERALQLGARLGGHLVSGHVDGVGKVSSVRAERGASIVAVSFPSALSPYLIPKGSITVDGVSLTVNELGADWFSVSLIPETLARTTLGKTEAGARVNLETDLIGKYVARLVQSAGGGLTADSLRRAGFGAGEGP